MLFTLETVTGAPASASTSTQSNARSATWDEVLELEVAYEMTTATMVRDALPRRHSPARSVLTVTVQWSTRLDLTRRDLT